MIALIQRIIEHGCGYEADGVVYFDTSGFPTYADFARLDLSGLEAGRGGRVKDSDTGKRHPNDFALWFSNKPRHIMQWQSPWGSGYPGWHIECSAMSMKYLGETFDIHCGGVDHVQVHHTNEIAQSECATGKPFVRYWLHGEFLVLEAEKSAEKMSKSTGNFITLQTVAERGLDPLAYRYLLLQAHYRSELKFSWANLEAAQKGLRGVYTTDPANDPLTDDDRFASARAEALAAINDDLNTPMLVGLLNRYGSHRLWLEFDSILGLDIAARSRREEEPVPAEVQALVDERNAARKAKNWARSDALRNDLIALGYEVGDSPAGTTVKRRVL
jgi:cysteinyl-tRNA synthetase